MRVGIIGAGQLGQMLGIAGRDLDLEFTFLDPSPDPPARVVGTVIRRPFDCDSGLAQLVSNVDVLTYEFENVPVEAIEKVADKVPVYPPPEALRHAQDRLLEKRLFESLGIPVAAYAAVGSEEELRDATGSVGLPLIVKTRRLGYDGKGQALLREPSDVAAAWQRLRGQALIAEQWIAFDREVSAIGSRNVDGTIAVYPVTENHHSNGILKTSRAPDSSDETAELAQKYLVALMNRLNYVGVSALELFAQGDALFANEFAPRVHNSGHWTIEGAATSQFENHLRAIMNMPPGDTSAVAHAGMANLIGRMPVGWSGDKRCYLHDYGKKPRPGRKLGHITVLADNAAERDRQLDKILEKLTA